VTLCETNPGATEGPAPHGFTASRLFTGAHWGDDDTIVFSSFYGNVYRVSAQGGTPQPITQTDADEGEFSHRLPQLLPDGDAILYTVINVPIGDLGQVVVQSLSSGERKIVVDNATDARMLPSGHLVFARDATLYAAAFDLERLELIDQPVPVLEGVQHAIYSNSPGANTGAAQFAVSENGTLLYASGDTFHKSMSQMIWVDRNGNVEPFGEQKVSYFAPKLSPDGRFVVVAGGEPRLDPWIYDLERDSLSRPLRAKSAVFPIWSADGRRFIYASTVDGPQNLYRVVADGSDDPERLTEGPLPHWASSVSPDGKHLLYVETHPESGNDIWVLPLEGDGEAELLVRTPTDDSYPSFSPDGRWLVYVSNFSGRAEVYVERFPELDARVQISNRGGTAPFWSRDGRELFYRQRSDEGPRSSQFMLVPVGTGDGETFQAGVPRVLLNRSLQGGTPVRSVDISPDGRRFLTVESQPMARPDITELRVVLDWLSELERAVPTNRR